MLTAQAAALEAMFRVFARTAAVNVGHQLGPADIYTKLAFKAQTQCCRTLAALAKLNSPLPPAFWARTSIPNAPRPRNRATPPGADGPALNGASAHHEAPAPGEEFRANELLRV